MSRAIHRIEATFDDKTSAAEAGLMMPPTLMARLGREALVNEVVRWWDRGDFRLRAGVPSEDTDASDESIGKRCRLGAIARGK